ncbi:MAG: hypothetical protein AABY64_06030 [Bdellovibrionota bacterium]
MKFIIIFVSLVIVGGKSVAKDKGCSPSEKACLAPPLEDYSAIPSDTIACEIENLSIHKGNQVVLTEPSEKAGPVVLNCHNGERSWNRRFQQLDPNIDFGIEAHYSYRIKSGVLVEDASQSLNFREITKNGFRESKLYKSLLEDGATGIKLNYILVKKNQKMRSVQDDKYLTCSFDTCPPVNQEKSFGKKIWDKYFLRLKEPAGK